MARAAGGRTAAATVASDGAGPDGAWSDGAGLDVARPDGAGLDVGRPVVAWPAGARSVLVVAVAHPPDRPELDWWFGRSDPPGNKLLAGIVQALCDWAGREFGLRTVHLPYHVERGGIYLKDAAVLAGLGCVGLNNLLVTSEYGPRVRLRALALDVELPPTGPVIFDPCSKCDAPCRAACPQGAFSRGLADETAAHRAEAAVSAADFSRRSCEAQMDLDIAAATVEVPGDVGGADTPRAGEHGAPASGAAQPAARASNAIQCVTRPPNAAPDALRSPGARETVKVIRYCRACELACPAGA